MGLTHLPFLRKVASAFLVLPLLAACSTLPRSGPDDGLISKRASASLKAGKEDKLSYVYVDLTPTVLANFTGEEGGSFYDSFGGGRGPAPEITVGVGDVVQVSLFESSTGGLFVPVDAAARPGNYVTLPSQMVDRKGFISVPYAGQVPAAGRTLASIQNDIVARLSPRAIEPQAIVAIVNQTATEASVVGEVRQPNTFAINHNGDRVLDMVSRAGGLRYPGYESYVSLQRDGRTATVFFDNLLVRPKENIYVAPGDTLYVYRQQRTFLAFGASGLNGQFDFQTQDLSWAEGVARAGGLLDDRADPRETFLYRIVDRKTLDRLGVDLTSFPPEQAYIPAIFRANFRKASEFFLAQQFQMRDKDILYVSNADAVELYKFFTLVNSVTGTGSNVARDAADTKAAIKYLKDSDAVTIVGD